LDNIKLNNLNDKNIKSEFLIWNKYNNFDDVIKSEEDRYDYILMADCLFFKNYHDDLLHTINIFLKDTGTCIIVAPSRGKSMNVFLEKAKEHKFTTYINTKEIDFIELCRTEKYEPFYIELNKCI
jgi:hypothetical protein